MTSAAIAATAVAVAAAAAGAVIGRTPFFVLASALVAISLTHHLAGVPRGDRWLRRHCQANKHLATVTKLGPIGFGAELGFALHVEMVTPLVWAGVALSAALGPAWAIGYGIGFGIGRAAPVIAAACRIGGHLSIHQVSLLFVVGLRGTIRRVGIALSVAFGLLLVGLALAGAAG